MNDNWTPSSTELPDDNITVLGWLAADRCEIVYREDGAWIYATDDCLVSDNVTHWQHLPEAPR